MESEVKVVKIGNSLRITIPKEVKAMDLKEESTVGLTMTNGDFRAGKIR